MQEKMNQQYECIFPIPILYLIAFFCHKKQKCSFRSTCKLLKGYIDALPPSQYPFQVAILPTLTSSIDEKFSVRLFFTQKDKIILRSLHNIYTVFDVKKISEIGITTFENFHPIPAMLLTPCRATYCNFDLHTNVLYFLKGNVLYTMDQRGHISQLVCNLYQTVCYDSKTGNIYYCTKYSCTLYCMSGTDKALTRLHPLPESSKGPIMTSTFDQKRKRIYFHFPSIFGMYYYDVVTHTLHVWIKAINSLFPPCDNMILDEMADNIYILYPIGVVRISIDDECINLIYEQDNYSFLHGDKLCDMVYCAATNQLFILKTMGTIICIPL